MSAVVFLGPSLPRARAAELLKATYLPPARQGDVWRALFLKPKVIVLIDGIFEAQPSVWHREILAALDSGVTVVGASSMGALRAAELHAFGMRGVGKIFEGYRDGKLVDDADVALLHADEEHDFRPMTVPLVNVRATVEGKLPAAEAAKVIAAAGRIFYQRRSWPAVLRALPPPLAEKVKRLLQKGGVDQKRLDAEAALKTAAKLLSKPAPALLRVPPCRASSLVRRRRIYDAFSADESLAALFAREDAGLRSQVGTRRALLAGVARTFGLTVPAEDVARAVALHQAGPGKRIPLAVDDCARLCEDALLEARMIAFAHRITPDGPSREEAAVAEFRWTGGPVQKPSASKRKKIAQILSKPRKKG